MCVSSWRLSLNLSVSTHLSVRLQIVPPSEKCTEKMENMHRELFQKCAVIQENCAKIVPMFYSAILIGDRDE